MIAWLCLLLVAPWVTVAAAQPLVTDLSDYHVAITSQFTGTQLLLFGAFGQDVDPTRADLIVVVRGPAQPMTLRRRERMFGIWANGDSFEFVTAPGYYQVASTRPLDGLASPTLLARNQIGLKFLKLEPAAAKQSQAQPSAPLEDYRAALVRAKIRDGLYREDIGSVTFVAPKLFRQTLRIPANVPIGDYKVEVYLVADGDIISAQSSPLFIGRIGTERDIFLFAHQWPMTFGIIAILTALLAGFIAGEIFRKD